MVSFKNFNEATYQGKKVPLNKPMKGDVKKSKVYVDPDGDGTAKKVNFGDKNMTIKKNIPARRKSFRARHKCDTAKDKSTPRYWSCKAWQILIVRRMGTNERRSITKDRGKTR